MVRLHVAIARAGVASRRRAEAMIAQGRVAVDGVVVRVPGTRVDLDSARVTVDGVPVRRTEPMVYYLLNKPRGVVCTSATQDPRPRAIDLVPRGRRVYAVGRLDEDSEGLIILTNDGALANLVTHPRYGVEKEYMVKVSGEVTHEILDRIRRGIWLSEGRTAPADVHVKRRGPRLSTLRVVVREGRNRLVRRVLAGLGLKVRLLRRIAIGPLRDPEMQPGAWRPLTRQEIEALRRVAGKR